MKKLLYFFLVLCSVSGCAGGTVNASDLALLQNLIGSLLPSTVSSAQNLDLNQLSTLLTNASKNPKLTAAQKADLADPVKQAMLKNVLQLVKGGSTSAQKAAATSLLSTTGTTQNLNNALSGILSLLQAVGPIIGIADPMLAPFIAIAEAVLPLVTSILNGSTSLANL